MLVNYVIDKNDRNGRCALIGLRPQTECIQWISPTANAILFVSFLLLLLLCSGHVTAEAEVAPASPDEWSSEEKHGADVIDLHRRVLCRQHLHEGSVRATAEGRL